MINISTRSRVMIALVCVLGVLYAIPNFFKESTFEGWPSWLPGQQINLGLDLQGGSHLLLEIGSKTVIQERLSSLEDSVRRMLRSNKILYKGLGVSNQAVRFTLRDPAGTSDVRSRLNDEFPATGLNQYGAPLKEIVIESNESGQFSIALTEDAVNARIASAVEQSIEIIRRRIDETGTREPTIQRQGKERILVQLPGVDDPERIKKLLGKTAKLNFHLVDQSNSLERALRGSVPPGSMLVPSNDLDAAGQPQQILVRKRVRVGGDHLVDAQATFQDNQPVVSFRFDTVGGRKFGKTTQENVGQLLAIVLDNKVISAPRVNEPILGGSGIISGRFGVQEAQDLALLLRAGALPAPITILEERTVGPGLGQDSINAGRIASIIGMVFVVIYMVLSYGLFGVMANIALFFNISLIIALLSGLQATLTLPGIAGIVLTIGMAVDANVLIFERIREETANGRTPISAIDAGYRRAITTIIDANLTTLIATVLLFAFGSGPIKGFAITLSIGILTSMFTAIMVTRLLIVLWLRRTKPSKLPI
ncbi:MAG: protein translocase subunit SecD [Alphaproteobacteria bacterium]|nr:protein translocase subunit SecD [Alphaproteobacteria bacterium]